MLTICIAVTLLFSLLGIFLSAAFVKSIAAGSNELLKRGHPLSGAAGSVRSIDVAYLLPWRSLPTHIHLSSSQILLLRGARISSLLAALTLTSGIVYALVAGSF